MKAMHGTFFTFLDKMQFSAILCLETYDWFCADRSTNGLAIADSPLFSDTCLYAIPNFNHFILMHFILKVWGRAYV